MLNIPFWQQINEQQAAYDTARRRIIGDANQALHLAKQAIFALHRDNQDEAGQKLEMARTLLFTLEKEYATTPRLRSEGAWTAAVEEWTEAALFLQYVVGEKVGEISTLTILPQEYLGALSDYTGELLRRAVLRATKHNDAEVAVIAEEITVVIELLLGYNLTGLLRTKFDQAKRNQQKMEEIMYDQSRLR
jgi:predicted translin family RNA/ssDNA-binding protein